MTRQAQPSKSVRRTRIRYRIQRQVFTCSYEEGETRYAVAYLVSTQTSTQTILFPLQVYNVVYTCKVVTGIRVLMMYSMVYCFRLKVRLLFCFLNI
jgi:hypothetical protein